MQTLKRLFELAGKQKSKLNLSIILGCLAELCGMIPYVVVVVLINSLYENKATTYSAFFMVLIALAGHTLRLLLQHYSTLVAHVATYEILYNIRTKIATKMLRVPMGTMINTPSGYYKNLIVDVVSKIEDSFAHFIPEVISSVVAPLFCIIAIFCLDVRMGFVSLITVPIGLFFLLLTMRGYSEKSTKWNKATNDMNASLVEYVNGIEVIKTFNQEKTSYQKFTEAINGFHDTTLDWWQQSWFCSAGVQAFLPTTLLGTLPFGAYFYMTQSIDLATFVACLVLPLGFIVPLMRLSKHTERFVTIKTCVSQIDEFLNEPELQRPETSAAMPDKLITFKNVSFGYSEKQVLYNLNFTIKPNGITALVGTSGSGKSTILKLIAGFWDIEQGSILFGKVPLKEMSMSQITDLISYVAQDNFLFNMSIKDNIKIGRPTATDEEVISAAKAARCHEFIMELPQGYDTYAGDFGNQLSGGERQRITIARAIIKNSPIILLDEATAFADPENEYLIQQAITDLVKNRTVVVVAHRLGTVKNANCILVMNEGYLVAQGQHNDLLKSCEIYRTLWQNYASEDMKGELEC